MDLHKRLKAANANRDLYRDLLEEAFDYVMPSRNNFSTRTEGDEENFHVYDETAPLAAPRFANRMQRSLFPESEQWIKFQPGSDIPQEEQADTDKALEDYTNTFFDNFNRTNFHREINPSFIDCSISTGVVQVNEESPTSDIYASFNNIPLNEIAFERPIKGELVNMWRTFKMVAEKIPQTWPRATIPTELQKIIDKEPYSEVEINIGQIKEDKVFKIYVLWGRDTLTSEDFKTQRMIAFRLNAFPGETFGRGPAIQVMPAIRDLNEIQRLIIENAAINVAGMYTARSDGIFNPWTAEITAGGIWAVASNDTANPTISRLPNAGDLNTGQIIIEEKQDAVRKAFFVDPMGDISDPVRSATEQTMRMQEFLKDQGAGIGRLRSELVEKVVLAFVDICQKRGALPKDIKVDGREVKVIHNTTLVKAEKQEDFQALMSWVSSLSSIVPPELLPGLIKIEELPRGMAEMLGVSATYVRSAAETSEVVDKLRELIGSQAGQEPVSEP